MEQGITPCSFFINKNTQNNINYFVRNFWFRSLKVLLVVVVFSGFVFLGYFLISKTELGKNMDSIDSLRNYISRSGVWSYALFWLLQFLQVTFLPIPSMLTTVAGVLLFGPFITFVLSYLAIMLGSITAFLIGKKFGSKIIVWVVGEVASIKWQERINRGKFLFFLMMLFPFFPDDLLCMISGANKMNSKFFVSTIAITKFVGLFFICFLGNSFMFNFKSPLWIVLGVVFVLIFVLSFIYKNKIETMFFKITNKNYEDKKTQKNVDGLKTQDRNI